MADMKIGIIGAGGRMGQACIRQVTETDGCDIVAASDVAGADLIGQDVGEAAGAGTLGVAVTDDAAAVVAASDAVIEFTLPGPTVDHVALTAEAGVAHIIGTTGMEAAARARVECRNGARETPRAGLERTRGSRPWVSRPPPHATPHAHPRCPHSPQTPSPASGAPLRTRAHCAVAHRN